VASLIYNSFFEDLARGAIDLDTDTFKVMALTATYSENKDTHTKRSDLTNEVSGTGYSAGGNSVTITVTKDTVNDRLDVTLGGTTWTTSTITSAQKFAYYKARGGLATADELVAVIDNGSGVSTISGTLTLNSSTLRVQN
jgi:hypothetical protein